MPNFEIVRRSPDGDDFIDEADDSDYAQDLYEQACVAFADPEQIAILELPEAGRTDLDDPKVRHDLMEQSREKIRETLGKEAGPLTEEG